MKFFVISNFRNISTEFNNEESARDYINKTLNVSPALTMYLAKGISEFRPAPPPPAIEHRLDKEEEKGYL